MKKRHLIYIACLSVGMGACSSILKNQNEVVDNAWNEYNVGTVIFEDKAPETKGSDIYHRIIPNAESYIKEQARTVLATLYKSPEDSIVPVDKIHYTLEDIEGISPKAVMAARLLSFTVPATLRNRLRKMIRQSCF